jgi:hypothetical protein
VHHWQKSFCRLHMENKTSKNAFASAIFPERVLSPQTVW